MIKSDLRACMNADSSTNALITGKIVYEELPKSFDKTQNWINWSYSRGTGEDSTCENDYVVTYELVIQCVSPILDTVDVISNTLYTYLNKYDNGRLRNIQMTSESENEKWFFDGTQPVWYKTLIYSVDYYK
jgi:hypothetical protein